MKFIALLVPMLFMTGCLEADKSGRTTTTSNPSIRTTNGVMRSQLHRTRSTAILTTTQESSTANNLPVGYDNIPNIFESDDGTTSTGASSVIYAIHTGATCGIGTQFASLQARIDNCATANPSQNRWVGQSNGNAGEGNWQLVARNAIGDEVWLDETTRYLWSDRIAEANMWCMAAGNTQGISDGGTVDCQQLNPNSHNLCSNIITIIPEAQVSWRLPTRADFLQADTNGARYVLRHTDYAYWTATVNGANRDEAWSIEQSTGILSSASRASGRAVRCIGRSNI